METYEEKIEYYIDQLKKGNNIFILDKYKTTKELLNDLKIYFKNNIDKNTEYILILKKWCTEDKRIFTLNDVYKSSNYNYIKIIRDVLNANKTDKEEAFNIVKNRINDSKIFKQMINRFNTRFANASLYNDILENYYLRFKDYEVNEKKRTIYIDSKSLKMNNVSHNIYDDVLNSGLSLLDFAHYNLIDNNKYNNYFALQLYTTKENADVIKSRKDRCINELNEIIKKINNQEIDIIEYYKYSKLNPFYLKKIAKENNLLTRNLSVFVSEYQNPKFSESLVDKEMEAKMVINQEEVSEEIKIQAKQYLIDNKIPINTKYYKTMVRKLIKDKSN